MNENNLQIEQQETNDNTFVKVEPLVIKFFAGTTYWKKLEVILANLFT